MPLSRRWLLSLSTVALFSWAGFLMADEGDAPDPAPVGAMPEVAPAPAPAVATSPEATAVGAAALAKPDQSAALWSDFNHYVRIARPDLAQAVGNSLLKNLDEQKLLDIVESGDYADYEQTLDRASRIETLKGLAQQLGDKIQHARITRSRDPVRIVADIQKLSQGERANLNALARLKAAGQFAAPSLLRTLLEEKQQKLHPYVLAAMVSIGRPLVYPLSVALPNLEAVPQGQIAQVLAEIGYPRTLPYLREVMENPKTDPSIKSTIEAAYRQLAKSAGVPESVTAAELYLTLGQNHYRSATRGEISPTSDMAQGQNMVWTYDRTAGLVPIPVPAAIYGDVLAMRAARTALQLNPQMDPALSLWLAANLRRKNRLPAGAADLSYGPDMLTPSFYMQMAGPLRQHDVLARALDDKDAALALDAIGALGATAGTDALINRAGTVQPLLRALSYPDRRVRFAAAFTMVNARSKSEFPGSQRVVPVLTEALRQTDSRSALVIGRDRTSVNQLVAVLKEMGYQAFGGLSLGEVSETIRSGTGVDLIVTNQGLEQVIALHRQTTTDYKLAAVPTIALVSKGDQIELKRRYDRDDRIRTIAQSEKFEELKAAAEELATSSKGSPIAAEEAQTLALTSLRFLHEIALAGSSSVYNLADAQPALIAALGDKRPQVVVGAAKVLAMIESPDAQTAIAEAALDPTHPTDMRVALLGSLADSATLLGNHLTEIQAGKLLDLVKNSQGDLALASSRAHGALTLPTANVVPLIIK